MLSTGIQSATPGYWPDLVNDGLLRGCSAIRPNLPPQLICCLCPDRQRQSPRNVVKG